MNYYGYEVDKNFVSSTNTILWKDSGNGVYIVAYKHDKAYFIKRNKNIRKPGREVESEVLKKKMNEECLYVENKQKELAKLMSSIDFEKDHIANEIDHFWDEGYFVTITRFVEHGISDTVDFSVLRKEEKRQILLDMARLIDRLQDTYVIHGDIKRANFVFTKGDEAHRYIPYLIDFDSSYYSLNIPGVDEIVFSPGYETPEIVCYKESEEPNPEIITFKNDIFTLGLEFHNIWTKKMPTSKVDKLSVGEALAVADDEEHKPVLNQNLNEIIGDTFKATFLSLVNWMLQRDPDNRPDIKEVVMVLEDKLSIPEEYIVGKDEAPFTRLWASHENLVTYDKEELKKDGYLYLKRADVDGKKYRLKNVEFPEDIYTLEELVIIGVFTEKDLVIEEPWEEDEINFVSVDVLKSKGIYKIKKIDNRATPYSIEFNDGMRVSYSLRRLLNEGIATKILKDPSKKYGEPFKEDNEFVYADDKYFETKGVKDISKYEKEDEHLYIVTYNDERGKKMFNSKTMRLLGYLVKEKR